MYVFGETNRVWMFFEYKKYEIQQLTNDICENKTTSEAILIFASDFWKALERQHGALQG